jgi:hypothetical protein
LFHFSKVDENDAMKLSHKTSVDHLTTIFANMRSVILDFTSEVSALLKVKQDLEKEQQNINDKKMKKLAQDKEKDKAKALKKKQKEAEQVSETQKETVAGEKKSRMKANNIADDDYPVLKNLNKFNAHRRLQLVVTIEDAQIALARCIPFVLRIRGKHFMKMSARALVLLQQRQQQQRQQHEFQTHSKEQNKDMDRNDNMANLPFNLTVFAACCLLLAGCFLNSRMLASLVIVLFYSRCYRVTCARYSLLCLCCCVVPNKNNQEIKQDTVCPTKNKQEIKQETVCPTKTKQEIKQESFCQKNIICLKHL